MNAELATYSIARLAKLAAAKAIARDCLPNGGLTLAQNCLAIAINGGEDSWWLTDAAEVAVAALEAVATYDFKRHDECGLRSAAADMLRQYLAA